jgi:hypothetical protein
MADRKKLKRVKARGHSRKRSIDVPKRKLRRRAGCENIRALPCKLTLRARKIVYAAIEMGLPLTRCHNLIGVNQSTMYTYLKYGEDPRYKKFYNFRQKIKKIERRRELEALKVIRESAKGGFTKIKTVIQTGDKGNVITRTTSTLSPQWQAAAWYLERKDKSNWGRDTIGESKSAAELAADIQEAQLALFNSVPTSDGEND